MIQKKFRLIFLAFLSFGAIGVVLLSFYLRPADNSILGDQVMTTSDTASYPIKYFDPDLFWPSVQATVSGELTPFQVGVVPHHAVAGRHIAEYFQQLSQHPPKTLVILGPNHANIPDNTILTSTQSWQSPFGPINTDPHVINPLVASALLTLDSKAFENEQSIGTLVPYIKYYLPDTKIVPIIFTKPLSIERLQVLASKLHTLADQDTYVLASIDFSHYLLATEADQKDSQTLACLTNHDYDCLLAFDQEHLDSAEALVTLLLYVDLQENLTMHVLRHTNAAAITGKISAPTTSYFVLGWRQAN